MPWCIPSCTDQEKEEEVQRVRLKNIHLVNQLKRIEQTLRQKEELAEGLHLIDFEQLKIENQSLNEKIEERNEELLKLRKKTTTTVQILTHVREKLQVGLLPVLNAVLARQAVCQEQVPAGCMAQRLTWTDISFAHPFVACFNSLLRRRMVHWHSS
jgi:DNA repair exonuclease SbcCD ATPase subunit